MRLTNFLLVNVAVLFASCEALAAATGSTQIKLTTATSLDAVPKMIDTVHNGKRLLWATKLGKENSKDDEDDDSYDDDEEEKANLLAGMIARRGKDWVRKWVAKTEGWAAAGATPGQIKDKYTNMAGVLSGKGKDKYDLFNAAWLKLHPGGY